MGGWQRVTDLDFPDDSSSGQHMGRNAGVHWYKIESGRKYWATIKCQQRAHDCNEMGVSPIVTATGMQIEKVEDFCYLGSVISNNIRSARDLKTRLGKANHHSSCFITSGERNH